MNLCNHEKKLKRKKNENLFVFTTKKYFSHPLTIISLIISFDFYVRVFRKLRHCKKAKSPHENVRTLVNSFDTLIFQIYVKCMQMYHMGPA